VGKYGSENYNKILINIMYLGLFLFIGGIYFLKDSGDIPRIFYLMVLLPCLLLLPKIIKEFNFNNKTYIIFMLLPIYLCISFLWAQEENIKRDFIFHLRNLFCVFFYMMGLWSVMKEKQKFIMKLLVFLFVSGFFTSVISVVDYFLEYGFTTTNVLVGYFIDNSNKVGSIYSIHLCLCAFLLFNKKIFSYGTLGNILMILALIVDVIVIFLSQAIVPWLIITIFVAMVIMRNWHWLNILAFSSFVLLAGFGLVYYLDMLEYFTGMVRVQARIDLVQKAIAQMDGQYLFGIGLSYKLPLVNLFGTGTNPHPHNIFVDCFRFGGLAGLLLIVGQFFYLIRAGLKSIRDNVEIGFILFWFVAGTILLSFYGQQPLARPGGYIWFFYWIPGTILLVKWIVDRVDVQNVES